MLRLTLSHTHTHIPDKASDSMYFLTVNKSQQKPKMPERTSVICHCPLSTSATKVTKTPTLSSKIVFSVAYRFCLHFVHIQ